MKLVLIGLVGLLFLVGCTKDYKAEVIAAGDWYGQFAGDNRTGTGNETFDLDDSTPLCCIVVPVVTGEKAQVRITWSGGFFLNPSGETEWSSTEICID